MKLLMMSILLIANTGLAYTKQLSRSSINFEGSDKLTMWTEKTDFARLERTAPLTAEQRNSLQPEDIRNLTQEEIEQLYGRLNSGPIPTGQFRGQAIIKTDALLRLKKTFYEEHKKTSAMTQMICKIMGKPNDPVECIAEMLWKGKVFYPPNKETDEVELRNAISIPLATPLIGAIVGESSGWDAHVDQKFFNGILSYYLFPAKVYCGQSLLDSRKESIIVDYAHGDDFKPFLKGFDDFAGRNGFDIRDEVRMIRPGFYLGRAYMGKIFILNFTLFNPDLAKTQYAANSQDACFTAKTSRQ